MAEAEDTELSSPANRHRLFVMLRIAAACVLIAIAAFGIWYRFRPARWPGWVGYTAIPSPNYNERPSGGRVDCIILHATAQPLFVDTIHRFEDPSTKVSAHFVVDRDGTVIQMVPLTKRAWHAGVSSFDGVPGVNDYSIGIEMTNDNDGKDPYPSAQYAAVAEIIRRCRLHYNIPDSRIVSHAVVALPPGRKTDPEGFDFARLFKILARK